MIGRLGSSIDRFLGRLRCLLRRDHRRSRWHNDCLDCGAEL